MTFGIFFRNNEILIRESIFEIWKILLQIDRVVINLSSSLKNRSKTFHLKMKFEGIESLRAEIIAQLLAEVTGGQLLA